MQKSFFLTVIFAFLFLFSDFYYDGVGRPFDYAVVLCFSAWLLFGRVGVARVGLFRIVGPIFFVSLPWVLVGLFNGNSLASFAIVVGILVVFPCGFLLGGRLSVDALNKALDVTVVLSFAFLFLQFFLYSGFGIFFDISGTLGQIQSRSLNESLGYFRPAGLFQEPNAYCTAMFCMLFLAICREKRRPVMEWVGIISMVLTQSLWGIAGAGVLLWLSVGFKRFAIFILTILIFIVVFFYFSNISIADVVESSVTMSRIFDLENDPSRQARYGSMEGVGADLYLLVGHGVDTANFQQIAANGIAFLVYSFGLIGLFLLSVCLVLLIRFRPKIWVAIAFVLTTFPLFSYMYFWFWLGVLVARWRLSSSVLPFLRVGMARGRFGMA